jgi:AraC-like DNA-binding protein
MEIMMNIAHIVSNKYNYKSATFHRHLNSDPENGILASGYIRKNTSVGSNIDHLTKSYHGLLVLSGTAVYKDAHHEISVKKGDFIQRIPGVTHSTIILDDHFAELYVILGHDLYKDLLAMHVLTNTSPVLHPGIDYETVQSILHIQDQLSFVDRLELPLLVPQIINYLARITYLSKANQQSSAEKDILSVSTSYIEENLGQRITVEDVANFVNMGYEKFRKLFTLHYNISPGNYIIHRRIEASQRLLSQTDISIKEVAFQLGYIDTYTFSKQFKKITGRTPSDFRNMYLKY